MDTLGIREVYSVCIVHPALRRSDQGSMRCSRINDSNSCELEGNLGVLDNVCVDQECLEATENLVAL